jgi:hypothetical protein
MSSIGRPIAVVVGGMLRTIAGRASSVLGTDLNCSESGWAKSSKPRGRCLDSRGDRTPTLALSSHDGRAHLPGNTLNRPGRPELHRSSHRARMDYHQKSSTWHALRPIASTACKRIGCALVAAKVCACIMSNESPLRLALLFAWRAVERARRALKVILAPPSRRGKRVIPGHQGRPGHQGHQGRRGLRERKVLLGRLALRRQSQVTAPSV